MKKKPANKKPKDWQDLLISWTVVDDPKPMVYNEAEITIVDGKTIVHFPDSLTCVWSGTFTKEEILPLILKAALGVG